MSGRGKNKNSRLPFLKAHCNLQQMENVDLQFIEGNEESVLELPWQLLN